MCTDITGVLPDITSELNGTYFITLQFIIYE